MESNSRLVYSSDRGRITEKKKGTVQLSGGDGTGHVRREKKGRGGKTVTTIIGLDLNAAKIKELASELKRLCGTGGSVKNGVIEIQGDNADKIVQALDERGYKAKRAGG